jgi:D-serine deaminase-like pyridoxal phosphate-dependent protein
VKPETRDHLVSVVLNLDLVAKRVSLGCPTRAAAVSEIVERSMRLTIAALEKLTAHVSGEMRAIGRQR